MTSELVDTVLFVPTSLLTAFVAWSVGNKLLIPDVGFGNVKTVFSFAVTGIFTPVVRMEIMLSMVDFIVVVEDMEAEPDDVLHDEDRLVEVSRTESNGNSLVEVNEVCLAVVVDLDIDTPLCFLKEVPSVVLCVCVVKDVLCRKVLGSVDVKEVICDFVVNVCSICAEGVVLSELDSDVFGSLAGEDVIISTTCPCLVVFALFRDIEVPCLVVFVLF